MLVSSSFVVKEIANSRCRSRKKKEEKKVHQHQFVEKGSLGLVGIHLWRAPYPRMSMTGS